MDIQDPAVPKGMAKQAIRPRPLVVLGLLMVCASSLPAQEVGTDPAPSPRRTIRSLNDSIPLPTLGGSQFWADVHVFHDWRIQQRVASEEYRLLGPREFSHASGSFEQCLNKLEQVKRAQGLEPMRGKAVVILHGLVATRWTMRVLAEYLAREGGYTIVNVEYPSTRASMADHARSLARVIDGLPEIEELNFVGHSMGNIVIRHYMADMQKSHGRQDPRVHRVVMIAPPNHGSIAATRWADYTAFKTVLGKPGIQLGPEWAWLDTALIAPPCQFGVIAGGLGNGGGFSPFLPGDDDGRITVRTTRLAGARDFVLVPMLHELIAHDPRTISHVRKFLDHGYFIAEDQREPILENPVVELARRPSGKSQSPPAESPELSPQSPGGQWR